MPTLTLPSTTLPSTTLPGATLPVATLPGATLDYRVAGPENSTLPPVLFVHGALVDHRLWTPVAELLAARGFRCVLPDWPLGSHRIPVDGEVSPAAVAEMIRGVIAALDLREVTLVGNDTGGAICQLAVTAHPGLVSRLVLTNCDAFDTFPPFPFNVVFAMLRGEWSIKLLMQSMRVRALRHSPLGYGLLCRSRPELTASWVRPCQTDPAIRANLASLLRHIATTDLMDAAAELRQFTGPVRVVWGMRDRCFTPALGRRLTAAFPDATMVEVPHASTFVALDAPEAVADAVEAVSASTRTP